MRQRIIFAAAILLLVASLPAGAQFIPIPSGQLVQTLSTLRRLDTGSFQQVVWWAPNPQDPGITVPDWNNAEHQIMQLPRPDRDAVLYWLNGHGRQRLYNRGATDAMIGPRRPSIEGGGPAPATPSPLAKYRTLQLTSDTLRGSTPPPSGVNVTSGFALIAKDGTKAIVCVSFVNQGTVAANTIHFSFPLIDAQGDTVGAIDFKRDGLFSPNIAIDGPASAQSYFDPGLSNRGAFSNCVTSNQGTAALPLLQTRYVTYKITGVTYTNGSAWP